MERIIYWVRQDLRIRDNPALFEAARVGHVLPVYILDDVNSGRYCMGEASQLWLYHSLNDLKKSLQDNLLVFRGDSKKILLQLAEDHSASAIYWNRCYEPQQIELSKSIKEKCKQYNIETKSYNASLLWEPWEVLKQDSTIYKVFTPYYRKGCLSRLSPRESLPKPEAISFIEVDNSSSLDNLKIGHDKHWCVKLKSYWDIGEEAAHKRFDEFLEQGIRGYKEGRNFPAKRNVSRLSPHIHFGEISPNYLWHKVKNKIPLEGNIDIETFCSEIAWREFAHYQLYHFPELPHKNWNKKFDHFPWQEDAIKLEAWKKGQTGVPIIDAGMRELWQTGYMHNRVRMIVGSFLVKNLMIDWRYGERWFFDCLFDADLASNSASWQWIAGCGADAAPYFRIFNPILQGKKFDPNGEYIKKFVPEIRNLPNNYIYAPWEASQELLKSCGVQLGKDYPRPITDLAVSRKKALDSYSALKELEE